MPIQIGSAVVTASFGRFAGNSSPHERAQLSPSESPGEARQSERTHSLRTVRSVSNHFLDLSVSEGHSAGRVVWHIGDGGLPFR